MDCFNRLTLTETSRPKSTQISPAPPNRRTMFLCDLEPFPQDAVASESMVYETALNSVASPSKPRINPRST